MSNYMYWRVLLTESIDHRIVIKCAFIIFGNIWAYRFFFIHCFHSMSIWTIFQFSTFDFDSTLFQFMDLSNGLSSFLGPLSGLCYYICYDCFVTLLQHFLHSSIPFIHFAYWFHFENDNSPEAKLTESVLFGFFIVCFVSEQKCAHSFETCINEC